MSASEHGEGHRKYAMVPRDGFNVPLIGIPFDASICECEKCKKVLEISKLTLDNNGRPTCKDCL